LSDFNSKTIEKDQSRDYKSPLYTENGLNFQSEKDTKGIFNANLNKSKSSINNMNKQASVEKSKKNIINIEFSKINNSSNRINSNHQEKEKEKEKSNNSLRDLLNIQSNMNMNTKNNGKNEVELGISNNIFSKVNDDDTPKAIRYSFSYLFILMKKGL